MTLKKKLTSVVLTPVLAASIMASSVSAAQFSDVNASHPSYKAVEAMTSEGIIKGFSDGTFKQYNSVTRAESAIMIGRALGVQTSTSAKTFTDLSASSASYPYVVKLMEMGVFVDSSQFNPARPLSRSEMAIILTRAFNLPASNNMPFTDVSSKHGAAAHIRALVAARITSGVGNGKYDPSGTVTRGQMAIFLNNALNYKPDSKDPDQVDSIAVIEARYASEFSALQAQAASELNILISQAQAELAAGADLMDVSAKYMELASSLEASTDASFSTIYGRLTAELTANGHSTASAEKFQTQYEAAKAKLQEELMDQFF